MKFYFLDVKFHNFGHDPPPQKKKYLQVLHFSRGGGVGLKVWNFTFFDWEVPIVKEVFKNKKLANISTKTETHCQGLNLEIDSWQIKKFTLTPYFIFYHHRPMLHRQYQYLMKLHIHISKNSHCYNQLVEEISCSMNILLLRSSQTNVTLLIIFEQASFSFFNLQFYSFTSWMWIILSYFLNSTN